MSNDALETIKELEENITSAKDVISRSQGALDTFTQRLKDEFSLNSLEEAEARIEELDKEIGLSEKLLQRKLATLIKDHELTC